MGGFHRIPAKRENDLIGRDRDAALGVSLDHDRLLMSGYAASGLPALDGGRGLIQHLSHCPSAAETGEEVGWFAHGGVMCDSFAQNATNNSHIHGARFSPHGGMTVAALALRALRARTQPKISSRDVAALLGKPPSTYAAYEDPAKFKKPILPFDLVQKLAPIFEERGIPAAETLALAGLTGEFSAALRAPVDENEWVEVAASVAAGVWKEHVEWPASERYEVRFGPTRIAGVERFGLRMEGLSMNRTIVPGSDLECIRVFSSGIEPRPGDLVIVQRSAHDLTEMTCKRLDDDGGEWVLRCESTEPEFQEPIRIGRPDAEGFVDDEIRVIGIVMSAKADLAPAGLSERRHRFRA